MVIKVIISCRISVALRVSTQEDGRSCTNADIPRRRRVSCLYDERAIGPLCDVFEYVPGGELGGLKRGG